MSVNQLTRVAIAMLALYWVIISVASLPHDIGQIFAESRAHFWLLAPTVLFATVLFAILPAGALWALCTRIADRLAPDSTVPFTASATSAYPLGCTLLAYFLAAEGVVAVISAAATAAVLAPSGTEPHVGMLTRSAGSATAGIAQLTLAYVLWRHALGHARQVPAA